MYSQTDSSVNYKCRKTVLISSAAVATTGSLVYLNKVWYSNYNTGNFHFFNDNSEWYGLDKYGHAYTTFQTSRLMIDAFKWAGYKKKQQIIGGTLGFGYMTLIEIMDGFSKGWGFSWGDMASNGLGTAISVSQYAVWNEQRFNLKFSFWPSQIAKFNPALLGDNVHTQLLKDYNAQTYWLSVSPFTFIHSDKKLPKWLAFSFGYGAHNMVGAKDNSILSSEDAHKVAPRYRQYFLSLDVDFSKIKTKSKILKSVFNAVNCVKIPFPAIEFQNGKTNFHYMYF